MGNDRERIQQEVELEIKQAEDKKALELYKKDPKSAVEFLNEYSNGKGSMVMDRCIELGDFLWTKYDEKF